jgi:hypothetical protein
MQITHCRTKTTFEMSETKAGGNVSVAAYRRGFRLAPLCASLVALGLSATFGQAHAQTISLTSASPSYALSGNQTVSGITVANGVNGLITGPGDTLTYSGATGGFSLGGTASGASQVLNMTGLTNFVFDNATQPFVVSGNVNSGSASGSLSLASTSNVITTSSFNIATIVDNGSSASQVNSGAVLLGQNNIINADTINVATAAKTAQREGFNGQVGLRYTW